MSLFTALVKSSNASSWDNIYRRIDGKRKEAGLSWRELAKRAGIMMKTWMVGLPGFYPSDEEITKIAPVLNTTFDYLKYGIEPEEN